MMFLIRPKPDNSFTPFRPQPPKGFPSDRVSQVTKPVPWLRSPPSKLLVPSLPYSNQPPFPEGRFLSQRSLSPHNQGSPPQPCSTLYTNFPHSLSSTFPTLPHPQGHLFYPSPSLPVKPPAPPVEEPAPPTENRRKSLKLSAYG